MSSEELQLDQLDNMSDDELSNLNLEQLLENGTVDTGSEESEVIEENDTATEDQDAPVHYEPVGDEEIAPNEEQKEIDYKAFYERVNQPFKANGRDFQINSADEAIQLMQMGANYNKKMQSLKPKTKVLKMLESNDLLDESKLAYLIDLNNKNPEAVAKLVQDSGIDALDLEDKLNPNYAPQVPVVSDTEIELDNILDELRDTPSYSRTIDIAGNQWDETSRREVATNPNILRGLNEHVYLGIYDTIQTEIERRRTLGQLSGMSDLQAYKAVGDWLNEQGAFNYLNPQVQQQQEVARQNQEREQAINQRRQAAATPNTGMATGSVTEFNPLAISDEDILRLANQFT